MILGRMGLFGQSPVPSTSTHHFCDASALGLSVVTGSSAYVRGEFIGPWNGRPFDQLRANDKISGVWSIDKP